MSWAPQATAESGQWVGNGLRFATREEAEAYVAGLSSGRNTRVVESSDPVNYRWENGRVVRRALSNFEEFFKHNLSHPYLGRLRLICLLQTAAKHFVDPDECLEQSQRCGGENDFDVSGFFQAVPACQKLANPIT